MEASDWIVTLWTPAGVATEELFARAEREFTWGAGDSEEALFAVDGIEPAIEITEDGMIRARFDVTTEKAEDAMSRAGLAFRQVLIEAGLPKELIWIELATVARAAVDS